ncbi:MAG TPA: AAA family ATPase [Candidatus Brocadiia bacterium]|nr:AAA family ATPase [Candidatus Brocadiia bacterium]
MSPETGVFARALLNLEPVRPGDWEPLISREHPEISALFHSHHPDGDAWRHTLAVMERLREFLLLPERPRDADTVWPYLPTPQAVYLAGLVHDLGRAVVPAEPWHENAPGHARHGTAPAREALRRLGLPFALREAAVQLVAHHHAAGRLVGAAESAFLALADKTNLMWTCELDQANRSALSAANRKGEEITERFRWRAVGMGLYNNPPLTPLPGGVIARISELPAEIKRLIANTLLHRRLMGESPGGADIEKLASEVAERVKTPTLHLLIGLPGSGKSTWASRNAGDAEVVCTDDIRESLTGDPADQTRNVIVFRKAMRHIRAALKEGRDIILDATNCNDKAREMPVRIARHLKALIAARFFDVSLSLALERNAARSRLVPEDVILRFCRRLEAPGMHEADLFFRVDDRGEETRIL